MCDNCLHKKEGEYNAALSRDDTMTTVDCDRSDCLTSSVCHYESRNLVCGYCLT